MKDTDKLTMTIGQLKRLISESKKQKKTIKESDYGNSAENIIQDIINDAQDLIDNGSKPKVAIAKAIDKLADNAEDCYILLDYYGTIKLSKIIESFYKKLYRDISVGLE